MKTLKCDRCDGTMKPDVRDVRYPESGLPNVILQGLRVYVCSSCQAETPEIPNLLQLHQVIAKALLTKPATLTGPEIRFLRRHVGLKAAEFAEQLGTTPVTVSRWETKANAIALKTDRLIRLLCVRKLEEDANRLLLPGLYHVVTGIRASARRSVPIRISRHQLQQPGKVFASA